MKDGIIYKHYLIRCESFQREENGQWVPQYTVIRQDGSKNANTDFPSHQYQFNYAYDTKLGADEFAVRNARRWIDMTDVDPLEQSAVPRS